MLFDDSTPIQDHNAVCIADSRFSVGYQEYGRVGEVHPHRLEHRRLGVRV
jgi:hypothetical protein